MHGTISHRLTEAEKQLVVRSMKGYADSEERKGPKIQHAVEAASARMLARTIEKTPNLVLVG